MTIILTVVIVVVVVVIVVVRPPSCSMSSIHHFGIVYHDQFGFRIDFECSIFIVFLFTNYIQFGIEIKFAIQTKLIDSFRFVYMETSNVHKHSSIEKSVDELSVGDMYDENGTK